MKSEGSDEKKIKEAVHNRAYNPCNQVRLAVERYEGNLKIDYDTKVFKVNIVIPINIEGSCYER